ncbi:MAG TPA: methyl-accepting chemotaxis protein [Spirochaetota bacterium]|nr:methyl-accepting chemotaxis protein [Spirochaetota bacterium]
MRWTIRNRLIVAFVVIAVLVIVQSLFAFVLQRRQYGHTERILALHDNRLFLQEKIADHLSWMNGLLKSIMLGTEFAGELNHTKCKFGTWYYAFRESPEFAKIEPEQADIFNKMEDFHARFHSSARAIRNAAGQGAALRIYENETEKNVGAFRELLKQYTDFNVRLEEKYEKLVEMDMRMINVMNLVVLLAIILIVGALSWRIIQSIVGSFGKFNEGFARVAGGDLRSLVETGTSDECGDLAAAFNEFAAKIRAVIVDVKDMANQLAASSEELSASSLSFADSAQNQAAATEEMTASIEEISAGMDSVAAGATDQHSSMTVLMERMRELSNAIQEMGARVRDSMRLSADISEKARTGEESLRQMHESMNKIGSSSREMTGIIQIINDISDRINLLSLNAAIEAARAGDAGRGFAVVADEISKLADQTASSIKEIDSLISVNEREIERGMTSVSETVGVIGTIIEGVSSIAGVMASIQESTERQLGVNEKVNIEADTVRGRSEEITNATGEQKIAITEIVKSISSINELTQAIASGSEEMSGNSEEMAGMAETLKGRVEYFST